MTFNDSSLLTKSFPVQDLKYETYFVGTSDVHGRRKVYNRNLFCFILWCVILICVFVQFYTKLLSNQIWETRCDWVLAIYSGLSHPAQSFVRWKSGSVDYKSLSLWTHNSKDRLWVAFTLGVVLANRQSLPFPLNERGIRQN